MKLSPCWKFFVPALALFAASSGAHGQTDNFDSGSLDPAWSVSAYSPPTITFPTNGTGRALRLQGTFVPNAVPAVAFLSRSNVYTDFYASVDVIDFAQLDQAVLLEGRMNNVNPPANASGYIINYDVNQYGAKPTNRRQGQFQLSKVSPGFATVQLGIAEFTLVEGGQYRFVLKGVGTELTAEAYDLKDLTKPLVRIVGNDSDYASGVCGIGSFSRSGANPTTAEPMDVTFDNYFAAATDPNLDIAPAIRHPLANTPQVVTRTPTNRFATQHPAAAGISFTANTFSSNLINVGATRLILNGDEFSGLLSGPSQNASSATFTTQPGTLDSNTVYTAQIVVEDASGVLKTTNEFWFDTFTDAYLTNSPVKAVEAEDYNYGSGQFQVDPIPVSGTDTNLNLVNGAGVGYFDQRGEPNIDYFDLSTSIGSGLSPEYRIDDFVGTQQGQLEFTSLLTGPVILNDEPRGQYEAVGVPEYQVRRFDPTEWMNYTRVFAATNYHVYLRVGSFGPTTASLSRVTSDPTLADQTTETLGTFVVPNMFMRSNYRYIPLTSEGTNVVVSLGGTNTVRLTSTGTPDQDIRKINPNFILFVPADAEAIDVVSVFGSDKVEGPYTAAEAAVDSEARRITVSISGGSQFFRLRSPTALRITSISRSGDSIVISYE